MLLRLSFLAKKSFAWGKKLCKVFFPGEKNFAKLLSQTSFDGYILIPSVLFVTLSVTLIKRHTKRPGFYSSPRYGFADGRYG